MTLSKLIQRAEDARFAYENARDEHDKSEDGEFDHQLRGLRLCDQMHQAEAAVKAHKLETALRDRTSKQAELLDLEIQLQRCRRELSTLDVDIKTYQI